MATNFNIKSMDSSGAVIRILHDDKLIDCRFPKDMADDQRMGWLKNTANEYLKNIGQESLTKLVPTMEREIGNKEVWIDELQQLVIVPVTETIFDPDVNVYDLPDADPEELQQENQSSWWQRIKGWFS